MRAGRLWVLWLVMGALSPGVALVAATLSVTADGRFFSVDGVPTFLEGVSYYAGCGISTPSFVTQDLDTMAAQGFNWIRVWMFWQGSNGENMAVMTPAAVVREPYMTRLKTLIAQCNQRGIIVDCTMQRDSTSSVVPANLSQHLACAQLLANQLLSYRNVYIDVANERDVGDSRFVPINECGQLITAIKAIDPQRVCTASGVPTSQSDLSSYRSIGKLDFITTHLCRDQGCSALTLGSVNQFVGWMKASGFRIPVHLQEPFRRGYAAYNPIEDDFYRDATGAKVAEAGGWCLHNGQNGFSADGRPFRSFLMSDSEGRLYTQFDTVEQPVSANLLDRIGAVSTRVRRYQVEYTEQISHPVGVRDGSAWSATPGSSAAGFMTQGPSLATVPTGQHQAAWRLKIDSNAGNSDLVVTIDVTRAGGTQVLASQQIHRQGFTASDTYQTFTLPFSSNNADVLDFRTNWPGVAKISLDWITLTIDPATDILTAPAFAAVTPNPDAAIVGHVYHRQLVLTQGSTPITWSLPQSPSGASIDTGGMVSGWTPAAADAGTLKSFTASATNPVGSDSTSWQVRVYVAADLDQDGDVDQSDFALLQRCFSGDAHPFATGCGTSDLDGDGDVDPADFAILLQCMAGPDRTPGC